jgi:hypothetical protein
MLKAECGKGARANNQMPITDSDSDSAFFPQPSAFKKCLLVKFCKIGKVFNKVW